MKAKTFPIDRKRAAHIVSGVRQLTQLGTKAIVNVVANELATNRMEDWQQEVANQYDQKAAKSGLTLACIRPAHKRQANLLTYHLLSRVGAETTAKQRRDLVNEVALRLATYSALNAQAQLDKVSIGNIRQHPRHEKGGL